MDKFEKYLLKKKDFIEDMLLIVHDEFARSYYQIELETVNDIIHHFNLIVKDEMSAGIVTNEE